MGCALSEISQNVVEIHQILLLFVVTVQVHGQSAELFPLSWSRFPQLFCIPGAYSPISFSIISLSLSSAKVRYYFNSMYSVHS